MGRNVPCRRLRYHPVPDLLAAADPDRTSHRAFGLPNLEFTESETSWPYKVGTDVVMSMRVEALGELPEPMNPVAAVDLLNAKDGYDITEADRRMVATGNGQLFGQFPIDPEGIVRWTFTEVPGGGERLFAKAPQELMSAAAAIAA